MYVYNVNVVNLCNGKDDKRAQQDRLDAISL
jgi:hypothetical protein